TWTSSWRPRRCGSRTRRSSASRRPTSRTPSSGTRRPRPATWPARADAGMAGPDCLECAVVRGGGTPQGGPLLRRGPFVAHVRPDAAPVPGWLFVAPARHVEQIDALDVAEQAGLGPLLSEVAAALRAETGGARVYVSVFAELMPHLHVHVVARPPDLPESER